MQTVKLSSKNQLVLPKEAREAMGVKGSDELLVVVKGGLTLILPKPKSHAAALAALGQGLYGKNHVQSERKSWR